MTDINKFVFGLGVLKATKADVSQAIGADAIAGLEVVEGKNVTTFAAIDEAGIALVDGLAIKLAKHNNAAEPDSPFKYPFSVSLAVPVARFTKEPTLADGYIRSSITSRRGIPTTTRFDERLQRNVLTTPSFWLIEIAIEVATESRSLTATKYSCRKNAEGMLEWQVTHHSEQKGGKPVTFKFEGVGCFQKMLRTTHVDEAYLGRAIGEAEDIMPRTGWQQALASHVMTQMGTLAAVSEEAPAVDEMPAHRRNGKKARIAAAAQAAALAAAE